MADYSKAYGSLNPKNDAKWFTDDLGGEFLIAPITNPRFKIASMKQLKSVETKNPDETLYSANEPYIRLVAEHIVLDWKNVKFDDEKDKVIDKYTVDNAIILFMNYELITQWVIEKSTELQNNKEKVLKVNKKK